MPKTLVGPIIGKVTETTARVLIEYSEDVEVEMKLTAQNDSKTLKKNVKARSPTIFAFSNLVPGTQYTVSINPYEGQLQSSLRTFKNLNTDKNLRTCWVSCNSVRRGEKMSQKENLWYNLLKEVQQNQYDILFHMGDQVYLDSNAIEGDRTPSYYQSKDTIFNKFPQSEWKQHENEIKEIIRNEYRRTWTFEPTAKVLANVSNIMFYDDHEIRDNWGFKPQDSDPNTTNMDYYFGKLAQLVYYEYQRQLWDENLDLNDISKINKDYTYFNYGKVGFFFIDIRGHRGWHKIQGKTDNNKQLGDMQIEEFKSVLKNQFKDMENLIVISQSCLVFYNEQLNQFIVNTWDGGMSEQWASFSDEQHDILKYLFDWKQENKQREVTICCGDMHYGGHTDIYYGDIVAFKQLTASAITNGSNSKYEQVKTVVLNDITKKLKDGFEFDHHGWKVTNNYGAVYIYNKQGKNYVDCQLIYFHDDNVVKGKKISNYEFTRTRTSSCCDTF